MKKEIIKIELYRTFFKDNSLNKLLEEHGYNVELYSFFNEEKKRFLTKIEYILREMLCIFKLIFKLKDFRNKKVLCLGGYYSVLLISRIFSFLLGKNFRLFIYNFYLHDAGEKKIVKKILHFLLNNKKVVLIVQSPLEVNYYKELADIPIHFVPYCSNPFPANEVVHKDIPFTDYIFTGGYTNRDYASIIKCAQELPQYTFIIAISSLNKEVKAESLPKNLHVYKDISRKEFEGFVSKATIVIIPLKRNSGASGQMLCKSAMQNKKPIIYCNVSAINYYFVEGTSGLPYNIDNPHSIAEKIVMLMSDKEKRDRMGNQAYLNYKAHFTISNRDQSLYKIIDSYE